MKELTTKLLEYLENTTEFMNSQVPELFTELLRWNFGHAILQAIGALLLIYFSFFLFKKAKKFVNEHDLDEISMILGLIGIVALISGVVELFSSMNTVIKIIFAPKVFLIEYLLNKS